MVHESSTATMRKTGEYRSDLANGVKVGRVGVVRGLMLGRFLYLDTAIPP